LDRGGDPNLFFRTSIHFGASLTVDGGRTRWRHPLLLGLLANPERLHRPDLPVCFCVTILLGQDIRPFG
tara:strand:- start:422 stop:628 length:207 start_codon:yes stop_codon:yes gene_type:complete